MSRDEGTERGQPMPDHLNGMDFDLLPEDRPRVGLIVLASDATIEDEIRTVWAAVPESPALFQARIANDPVITPDSLAAMGPGLSAASATLLPGEAMDVIGYGCTSASTVLGEAAVADAVRAAKPGARVTTPVTAAFAALDALGIRRAAVLTPYTGDVNAILHRYLTEGGLEIPVLGGFGEPDDARVARISPASLTAAIRRLIAEADVDGVFVSCTAIRLLSQIETLERALGLPVTSSNQALIWHMLRLAGSEARPDGLGRLFRI